MAGPSRGLFHNLGTSRGASRAARLDKWIDLCGDESARAIVGRQVRSADRGRRGFTRLWTGTQRATAERRIHAARSGLAKPSSARHYRQYKRAINLDRQSEMGTAGRARSGSALRTAARQTISTAQPLGCRRRAACPGGQCHASRERRALSRPWLLPAGRCGGPVTGRAACSPPAGTKEEP